MGYISSIDANWDMAQMRHTRNWVQSVIECIEIPRLFPYDDDLMPSMLLILRGRYLPQAYTLELLLNTLHKQGMELSPVVESHG